MKLLARLALLACLLLVGGVGVHARGTLESSLQEVGGNRRDLLYVVLFSLPDCPYCVAVRDAYLPALLDDPRFRGRVRIREVSIGSPRLLKDFNGDRISHADIARRYKVKFAPTVLFLDAQGQPRADALLGGDSVGLYGGYLENRVTQGLAQ
ncbi:thioredoxin fold domain-containing protein [Zoogloea sp.]|jgi:hypothetical protein|uniref:thioredoxin fold domain-containing protein n=1 Tax=Zoogloea sp. TaxID=49181 RepID=UPI0037DA0609